MPNAGLPQLTGDGAHYPLTPGGAGRRARAVHRRVRARPWSAAAAAPRPSTCAAWWTGCAARPLTPARPRPEPGVASLYQHVPFRQDTVVPGHRRAHQRQRVQGVPRRAAGRPLGRLRRDRPGADPRRRAPARPVRGLRRAGTAPPTCARSPAGSPPPSTLPLVLDSTEPAVIQAGLELLGGRAVVNSVNYEDGDGPGSRYRPDHAAGRRARRRGDRADHRRARARRAPPSGRSRSPPG